MHRRSDPSIARTTHDFPASPEAHPAASLCPATPGPLAPRLRLSRPYLIRDLPDQLELVDHVGPLDGVAPAATRQCAPLRGLLPASLPQDFDSTRLDLNRPSLPSSLPSSFPSRGSPFLAPVARPARTVHSLLVRREPALRAHPDPLQRLLPTLPGSTRHDLRGLVHPLPHLLLILHGGELGRDHPQNDVLVPRHVLERREPARARGVVFEVVGRDVQLLEELDGDAVVAPFGEVTGASEVAWDISVSVRLADEQSSVITAGAKEAMSTRAPTTPTRHRT